MYRKNLMRVCLAAIMAATVVTTSVPVYAAEPVATKQETAKTRTITIKYQEEDGTLVSSYDLLGQPDELGAVNQKVVKSHLPNGCELVNPKDSYEVGADGGDDHGGDHQDGPGGLAQQGLQQAADPGGGRDDQQIAGQRKEQ